MRERSFSVTWQAQQPGLLGVKVDRHKRPQLIRTATFHREIALFQRRHIVKFMLPYLVGKLSLFVIVLLQTVCFGCSKKKRVVPSMRVSKPNR